MFTTQKDVILQCREQCYDRSCFPNFVASHKMPLGRLVGYSEASQEMNENIYQTMFEACRPFYDNRVDTLEDFCQYLPPLLDDDGLKVTESANNELLTFPFTQKAAVSFDT